MLDLFAYQRHTPGRLSVSSVSLPLPLRLLVSGATHENLLLNSSMRASLLSRYSRSSLPSRASVTLELVRDFKDGSDRFVILDWPPFTRSQESQTLEAEIRARLAAPRASNQAMVANAARLDLRAVHHNLYYQRPASGGVAHLVLSHATYFCRGAYANDRRSNSIPCSTGQPQMWREDVGHRVRILVVFMHPRISRLSDGGAAPADSSIGDRFSASDAIHACPYISAALAVHFSRRTRSPLNTLS